MTAISFAASGRSAPKPAPRPYSGRSNPMIFAFAALLFALPAAALAQKKPAPAPHSAKESQSAGTPVLLDAMATELHRAFTSLGKAAAAADDKQLPPYFLGYSVADASAVAIQAQFGALGDRS